MSCWRALLLQPLIHADGTQSRPTPNGPPNIIYFLVDNLGFDPWPDDCGSNLSIVPHIAACPIVAVAAEQAHAASLALNDQAVAVIFGTSR
jgi:hypothetical protein